MASRFRRSVPVTINEVLDGHVALDLQCLDRLYLHGYLAQLQVGGQVIQFLRHRGYPVPSPACLQQIGDAFRRRVASFAEANHIPVVTLKAADRNIDVMKGYLDKAAAAGRSQVAAIGVAQEMQRVLIARQRDTDPSKPPQFSFDKKDRRVTVYYFYLWDASFGAAFIKVCTYCPWPVKIWVNGHEWAKQQARKIGLRFTELSNGFASCEDPGRLQRICDVPQPVLQSRFHAECLDACCSVAAEHVADVTVRNRNGRLLRAGTGVQRGAAVARSWICEKTRRCHGRSGQHRRCGGVRGKSRCPGQGPAGPGHGTAAQCRGGAGLRPGAVAGDAGELLGAGPAGRA
jgi:hypothetical protein